MFGHRIKSAAIAVGLAAAATLAGAGPATADATDGVICGQWVKKETVEARLCLMDAQNLTFLHADVKALTGGVFTSELTREVNGEPELVGECDGHLEKDAFAYCGSWAMQKGVDPRELTGYITFEYGPGLVEVFYIGLG